MSPLQQIWTIARLELGRVFLSKRSLWVYLLAFFPTVIFVGHAVSIHIKRSTWAGQRTIPAAVMNTIKEGMTDQDVIALAGEPINDRKWKPRRRRVEEGEEKKQQPPQVEQRRQMTYYDGQRRMEVFFDDGKLTRTSTRKVVDFEEDRTIYAGVFQYFYLRLAIFFGCLGIFINLFRGEMLDKSLHFWFLAPVKREILLLGKYLAGLIAAVCIFGLGALTSFYAMVFPQDPTATQAFWQSVGVEHAFWYVLAAMLACVGYGSVFLAAGLLLRNPITPAVTLLFWEAINGFLPTVLQKISVLHYVMSLCPVPAPMESGTPELMKLFLTPAPPSSAIVSILGLLGVTALVLYAASLAVRRLEINYGTE